VCVRRQPEKKPCCKEDIQNYFSYGLSMHFERAHRVPQAFQA
jgi:hypothetical protein